MSETENLDKAENIRYFNRASPSTSIPVDVNFESELKEIYNEERNQSGPLPKIQQGSRLESFLGGFGQQSTINALLEYNSRRFEDINPMDDYVDPNWKPTSEPDKFINIQDKNIGYLLESTGPKDLIRRRNYILDHQEQEEKINNGSTFYHYAGGFLGATLGSPESILMFGKTAKYAKMSQEFIQSVPKVLGMLSLSSAAHEATLQATHIGGNIEDWAIDTFADIVLDSVLVGVGTAASHLLEAQKLYNAKGLIQMLNKDIEPRAQINEKGELVGWKATPMNSSVGAAEVDMAQAFLDGSMAKNSFYHIPYVGDKIGYAVGESTKYLAGKLSPIVRNLNSDFPTMRGLMNNVADHGIDTIGVKEGRPNPDSFSHYMDVIRGTNTNLYKQYRGLYLQRNGIKYSEQIPLSQTKATLTNLAKEKIFTDHITREQFGREVQNAIINAQPSQHAAVNEAVEMINKYKDDMYRDWLREKGYSDKIIPPKTAEAHFMRVYHAAFMETIEGENKWMQVIPEALAKDDAEITNLLQPINNLKEARQELREQNLAPEIKKAKLEELSLHIERLEDELQNELRENTKLHRHIEDINAVSANEARQINKLMKPIRELEQEIKATKDKVLKRELKLKLNDEHTKLRERIQNKEIDASLVEDIRAGFANLKLKDANHRLKLREVYKSDKERQAAAKGYYDTILNQTTEDNIRNIMGKMMNNPRENPLGRRTLMIRDQILYDNNFLHPEPIIALMNYRQTLGRQIAISKVLKRLSINGTHEEVIQSLEKDFAELKNRAVTEKQRNKISKKYRRAKKDMELIFAKMEGRSNVSQVGREWSTLANLWAVATKLGFMPLTMSTDMAAIAFKHGFWPTVRDGLLPMLKSLGTLVPGKTSQAIREEAGHALLGMQDVNMAYSDKNWTGTTQTYEPIKGKLTTGFETLAHYSMNWSGANYVENFLQRWTAQVIQSKIIKAMLDFEKGNISKSDHESLLRYGLDPKVWSKRIINEWKAAGSDGNGFGGYRSNYWKWQDLEAANRVSSTIMRGVRDTIIRRGQFDVPFAMDNPIVNSIFLFKGYTFTTINRFLVPLLQQPDAQKIVGTLLMMTAGATQNPLRRIVSGQDPHQEDDHMFRNAMRDGGVFSSFMDLYEDFNFATNGLLEETVTNERYKNRLEMGTWNGPALAPLGDMARVIGMMGRGEWNQQDVKRLMVNIPFLYAWQTRYLANKMLQESGLPETRAQAQILNRK